MCRAPRFLSFRVQCIFGRDLVELLCHELELERLSVKAFYVAVLLFYSRCERLFELLSHAVYDFSESRLDSIVDGIIDDCFTIWTEAVHLFESAVTAAHSGSKD